MSARDFPGCPLSASLEFRNVRAPISRSDRDYRTQIAYRAIVVPYSPKGSVLRSRWSFGVGVGGFSLNLLPFRFLGQLAFEAFPLSGLQKKGVFLNLLDDALLLNLSLEAPKRAFYGFTIEDPDLCQSVPP